GVIGGKSLGCSHTCVCESIRPEEISAQNGQVAVPSRRLMRWGPLMRYCRRIGFQTKAVSTCIVILRLLSSLRSSPDGPYDCQNHLRDSLLTHDASGMRHYTSHRFLHLHSMRLSVHHTTQMRASSLQIVAHAPKRTRQLHYHLEQE